jgi:hypothetical protein
MMLLRRQGQQKKRPEERPKRREKEGSDGEGEDMLVFERRGEQRMDWFRRKRNGICTQNECE